MQDPYVYPGTTVLRNKLGITDGPALAQREGELAFVRTLELRQRPVKGRFDFAHLRALHRHIFQDIYPWAGDIRTVALSKGDTLFALPQYIQSYGDQLFVQLGHESGLRGLDHGAFAERAAYYWGEINALHPFREGNGRTQREFMTQLAREAGYILMLGRDCRRRPERVHPVAHVALALDDAIDARGVGYIVRGAGASMCGR